MKTMDELKDYIKNYHLPTYNEIPNVGLYLDQVVKYINSYLSPLTYNTITPSMISNYVKKGLVPSPEKKQYSRYQIALFIYIAICKMSLSLENVETLMKYGLDVYDPEEAYTYFVKEFEANLLYVFDIKKTKSQINHESSEAQMLLGNTVTTVTYQIYLSHCFKTLCNEKK